MWCKGFVANVFVTAKNLGKGIKNLLCYQPSPYVLKIFGVNKAIVIDVLCICSLPRLFLKISRYSIRKKFLKKTTSNRLIIPNTIYYLQTEAEKYNRMNKKEPVSKEVKNGTQITFFDDCITIF